MTVHNRPYDVIIVGSGINSLVCATLLGLKGRRVLVLERAAVAGGCIRTEEVTAPGFHHDIFAMSYPLFVSTPFYQILAPLLAAESVHMVEAVIPTGVLLPDGQSLLLRRSRSANVTAFGAAHQEAMAEVETDEPLIFGLLGQGPRSFGTLKLLLKQLWSRRLDGMAAFTADALEPARAWLERSFSSGLTRALIAPWVLHVGLGPDSAFSAMMAKVVLFTLETAGIPFVQGGGGKLVDAFIRIIERHGGEVRTGTDVVGVTVVKGRATGIVTASGDRLHATRAVICNTTPTQLYGRLLAGTPLPAATRDGATRYRYGRANMQIHIALSEPPCWSDPELGTVGLLHLTGGMNAVSRSVTEAECGLLPSEATIVVGQPAHADPSRCPPGASLLWIQLQELPRHIQGDAAGLIPPPADGLWTDEIAAAYAERILARLRPHISNLDTATVGIRVMGPHMLEAYNINLVGGDPYSGVCSVDQFHLLRPFAAAGGHATPVTDLYHIGASTHPGPGLGGVSGQIVAQAIG
ncbi:NAD(P)/FAD-dependent oxidoreductase [soil metagenome]